MTKNSGQTDRKSSDIYFYLFYFFDFFLTYFTEGVQWFISKKNMIFQVFFYWWRGGPTRGPTFSRGMRGVQMLIPIETYRTYDFPGLEEEVQTPCPLSDSAHVWKIFI